MLPEKFSGGVSVSDATMARISASLPVIVKPPRRRPDAPRQRMVPAQHRVAGTPVTTTLSIVS